MEFEIHSLLEFFVLKEFFINRKSSDEIRINLTFHHFLKDHFENQFLRV